ncbi:hypothetical protein MYA_1946 [Burkholderia sp. KJ006]|uniref:ORC-CDC6 family AAA ATPase n=1 Tax=Burkholderia sp. KJ006 TaxID=416344 RepID=UPI00025F06E1|nr:hypothetical protein [Burkholderia sp. KJ006]AFJ86307.1 hypothetical protein MYA_1946 [Burkholderia sp. KJ006]
MDTSIGFFSSFNARHLDAEQVAGSFVPNKKFIQLLAVQNSLLVGARGSGKTHMLKMLQPKAMNAWSHPEADAIRRKIAYWGVFVPADEAWQQQVECAAADLAPEFQSRFRLAVFTTHVQRSLVDSFLQLTHDRPRQDRGFAKVDLTIEQESEVCKTIAQSWQLAPRIHSLLGLRQALVDRAADLYECTETPERLEQMLAICQSQCVQAVLRAVNAFDSIVGRFEGRWCLMFDELEIAPAEVQKLLFRSLRSTDQKLIFKLALSPSTEASSVFQQSMGPSSGNDFEEISLYTDPKESAIFCQSLWDHLSKGTSAEHLPPAAILRHSAFHEPESAKPYGPRGHWQEASSRLAKKDPSYVEFLQRYGLDPNKLDAASPHMKDAVVRKIGPLIGFRDFMLKPGPGADNPGSASLRNDKGRPSVLFSGWEALCLVTEGNPRWFTGIANNLLIHRHGSPSGRELSRERQYQVLRGASQKFMDYIATIPSPGRSFDNSQEGGLKAVVDRLVDTFHSEVLLGPFVLDPVLSFEVDDNLPPELQRAIFDGLYAGAFVPVSEVDRQFAFSRKLSGQRLRLTYLISPLKVLPLRTGKERKLSTLLSRTGHTTRLRSQRGRPRVRTSNITPDGQVSLFNE